MTGEIKLTAYSKGGGCGCKIAPSVLEQILKTEDVTSYKNLLVGNDSRDDAAVWQIDNENAVISTSDFFLPIVNDPFDFGKIAAANSISDVYAMGGKPLMAIALLGWPTDKLPVEVAQKVLEGARAVCKEAGIPLAGGHTIDSQDPVFGMAVTGTVKVINIKKNNTALPGDILFLTKAVGTGVLSTALKRGLLKPEHYKELLDLMTSLNSFGEKLSTFKTVHAMTDVTGFGLLGHLIEMVEGSGLSAVLNYNQINKLNGLEEYLIQKTIPDATFRNWNSYNKKVQFAKGINILEAFNVLPDPQTNGGLLIAVSEEDLYVISDLMKKNGLQQFSEPVGKLIPQQEKVIYVN